MNGEPLLIEDPQDGVRVLTLNRPHRLNALDCDLVQRLLAELDRAEREHLGSGCSCCGARGAGTSFCPGADLKWLSRGILGDRVKHARFQDSLGQLVTRLTETPQAVIASVHGYALAGGLEMALACDVIVAARDARLGDQHINRGTRRPRPVWSRSAFRVTSSTPLRSRWPAKWRPRTAARSTS